MPSSDASSPEVALPPLVVICGATATGKTALSLALAERPGMEVVVADSRQVYRGMDVGTAKSTAAERARVPHHGLDLADPDEPFTVADYASHAARALADIGRRGATALLVGGTGLYLRAVARGVPVGETGSDPELRDRLERRLATEGAGPLVTELRARAPGLASRTDLRNPRRVVRALERAELVGDAPPPSPRGYPGPVLWLGLDADPVLHREAITSRARAQFQGGLLEEAAALRARYGAGVRAWSAIGYREAFAVFDGDLTMDDAIASTAARTWRYARRQRTWFRGEPGIEWLSAYEPGTAERARERIAAFLS
jgi:tRNA dimethylallyltransferase